ncbi:MFS transporter [Pseudoneobacillus rhizosphaerae]|uniref:Enterobactin exporter EntS n=1 Tax=Pseudoneobacillus rhizosphaerae TaxID=2880968 RepID=A0A9C7G782_9BACI|nr:MFS transporter [Pseudoneobacillus rhizosphaerae]CAG9607018.1 Enterobactin exporter EntS [Pseudoneobacillus rhizosphaerae]
MDESLKFKKATYHLYTFMVSKLISTFGSQVYAFAISFYILQLTGSASSFATNLICNILPRTLIAPFVGAIADKYSKRMIVITAQIATTLTIGGLLVVTLTSGLSLVSIYATTCILSISSTFSGVTFTASITGLIDKERIQKAMSLNQMSISFAAVASPAVGGLLYGTVSIPVFLIIYMVASSVAVILESTMNFRLFANQKQVVEDGEAKETMFQSIKAGIRYLKLQPIILTMMWIGLLINFLFGAFEVGYSYILIDKLKMESQHFGFTQGAFSIGMLLMSVYFSVRKEVRFPLLISKRGILGMAVLMGGVALPLLNSLSYGLVFAYYMTLMFCFGLMIIVINTPLQVMLQKTIDDDYKGRVFSIIETMSMALMPLGMVLYGFLYDIFPGQWILLLSAALLIVVVLILARPSVLRKVHPELEVGKGVKAEAGAVS